jgi:hypothetical protein
MRLNAKKAPCPAVNKGLSFAVLSHFFSATSRSFQVRFALGAKSASTVMDARRKPNAVS